MPGQGPTTGGSQIGQLDMTPAQTDANSVNVPFFGQSQPGVGQNAQGQDQYRNLHPDFQHMLFSALGQFGEQLQKQQKFQQAQQAQFQQSSQEAAMNRLASNPLGQGLAKMFKKIFGAQAGSQFQPTTGPMPASGGGDTSSGDDGQ